MSVSVLLSVIMGNISPPRVCPELRLAVSLLLLPSDANSGSDTDSDSAGAGRDQDVVAV